MTRSQSPSRSRSRGRDSESNSSRSRSRSDHSRGPRSSGDRSLPSRSASPDARGKAHDARVRPSPISTTKDALLLHVSGLTRNLTEGHLLEIFSAFGNVQQVELVIDPNVNIPRGYAFIHFVEDSAAEKALWCMDGGWIDGKAIRVQVSTSAKRREAIKEREMDRGGYRQRVSSPSRNRDERARNFGGRGRSPLPHPETRRAGSPHRAIQAGRHGQGFSGGAGGGGGRGGRAFTGGSQRQFRGRSPPPLRHGGGWRGGVSPPRQRRYSRSPPRRRRSRSPYYRRRPLSPPPRGRSPPSPAGGGRGGRRRRSPSRSSRSTYSSSYSSYTSSESDRSRSRSRGRRKSRSRSRSRGRR